MTTRPPLPGRLALPPTERALHQGDAPGTGDRAAHRVLRVFAAMLVVLIIVTVAVPLSRTLTLPGQLVPERTVVVRAAEPGLLSEILVAAGDTVAPGQIVARLRSPALVEAMQSQTPGAPQWPLLDRLSRLDVHAPAWASERASGDVDASTIFAGGVVLTDRLDRLLGAPFDAGDAVIELAVLNSQGHMPFVVEATANERQAQRTRPGMPARITIAAVPNERPRQVEGIVRLVSPAPEADGWGIEVHVDAQAIEATASVEGEHPTMLRPGFSVEVAVEERRETLLRTLGRWIETRWDEV